MALQDLRDRPLGDPEQLGNVLLARPGLAHTNDPIAQICTQLTYHGYMKLRKTLLKGRGFSLL